MTILVREVDLFQEPVFPDMYLPLYKISDIQQDMIDAYDLDDAENPGVMGLILLSDGSRLILYHDNNDDGSEWIYPIWHVINTRKEDVFYRYEVQHPSLGKIFTGLIESYNEQGPLQFQVKNALSLFVSLMVESDLWRTI